MSILLEQERGKGEVVFWSLVLENLSGEVLRPRTQREDPSHYGGVWRGFVMMGLMIRWIETVIPRA